MKKAFSNENQIEDFVENISTSKPAELYTKVIEDLPGKRQQALAKNETAIFWRINLIGKNRNLFQIKQIFSILDKWVAIWLQ